jgi:hypothetical protein
MLLMRFALFTISVLSLSLLSGCEVAPIVVENEGTASTYLDIEEKASEELLVISEDDVVLDITFPDDYQLSINVEDNRRGSYISYDFAKTTKDLNVVYLAEIQFFDEMSIEAFAESCEENEAPCFVGDYPTLDRYQVQLDWFEDDHSSPLEDYESLTVSDRDWLVSNFDCEGDSCSIREYTTFIEDVKVDVWVMMNYPGDFYEEADELFKQVGI